MIHRLLTLLLFVCSLLPATAQLHITPVSLHPGGNWLSFRFPLVQAKNKAVARAINQVLQEDILSNESIETDSTRIFEASRYINDDSVQQSGHSAIDYAVVVNNARVLSIRFDMESTGAYSTNYPLYHNFDSRTGKVITAKDLFTPAGRQALYKKLLKERKQRVARHLNDLKKEMAESVDSAFIRERFAKCLGDEEAVSKIFIRPGSIVFYQEFCFPHMARPYEAELDVEMSLRELSPYLAAYGKQVLGVK